MRQLICETMGAAALRVRAKRRARRGQVPAGEPARPRRPL